MRAIDIAPMLQPLGGQVELGDQLLFALGVRASQANQSVSSAARRFHWAMRLV
jgi:hypothetical protein